MEGSSSTSQGLASLTSMSTAYETNETIQTSKKEHVPVLEGGRNDVRTPFGKSLRNLNGWNNLKGNSSL